MQSRSFDSSPSVDGAQANVRSVVPALEAYYADNGTYAGATVQKLQATYDAGLDDDVQIVLARERTYCVESAVGGVAYHKAGPAADITPGSC